MRMSVPRLTEYAREQLHLSNRLRHTNVETIFDIELEGNDKIHKLSEHEYLYLIDGKVYQSVNGIMLYHDSATTDLGVRFRDILQSVPPQDVRSLTNKFV